MTEYLQRLQQIKLGNISPQGPKAKTPIAKQSEKAKQKKKAEQPARVFNLLPRQSKPIPKQSKKRIKEQRVYVKIVKELIELHPSCQLKSPVCTIVPTGLHHMKKRTPETFLNKKFLLTACTECNNWIESNSKEALELGLSLSKFK